SPGNKESVPLSFRSPNKESRLFPYIDQPRYPKSINKDAESLCPECLLQLHLHSAVPRQLTENALPFRRILKLDIEREALRLLIRLRRQVRALEHVIARDQRNVVDLVTPS